MAANKSHIDSPSGPTLSGTFSAPVTIHSTEPLPPELQNGTIREIALSTARGMMEIADRLFWFQDTYKKDRDRDAVERHERQAEADQHRTWIRIQLSRLWITIVVFVFLFCAALVYLGVVVIK